MQNEQIQKVRQQLIEQIKTTFPEEKRNEALAQIESMDEEQFILFLEKNNLLKDSEEKQGIFRAIVSGQIPSTKISESEYAIAVLEINPYSRGHTIIIPKSPANSEDAISKETKSFSEKVSKKLKEKLKAQEIKTSVSNEFGEAIINLIPVYNNSKENLQRYKAENSELKEIENLIKENSEVKEKTKEDTEEKKLKPKTPKKMKKDVLKNIWLPKRIP